MNLNLEQVREKLREELPTLRQRFSVKSLAVFGSVARREPEPNDLDLLMEFNETPGLFEYVELECLLSDLLGMKVDLVMPDALKLRIGQRILQEAIPV